MQWPMASRPVGVWAALEGPASNSSAHRWMDLESGFVPHQHIANEEIACSRWAGRLAK